MKAIVAILALIAVAYFVSTHKEIRDLAKGVCQLISVLFLLLVAGIVILAIKEGEVKK